MRGERDKEENRIAAYVCLLVFCTVTVVVALLHRGGSFPGSSLVTVLWGVAAIAPLRRGEGSLLRLGVTPSHLKKNLQYFFLSSIVVFPLYSLGFWLYASWGLYLPEIESPDGTPIFRWLLYNLFAIAVFEELFFRGYVQGRFENYAKARLKSSAAVFWVPIGVSAFLFALAHMAVYLDPLRLTVFFPGLLFGWLRAKSGSLLAPILSHGTANLVSALLLEAVS